MPLRQKAHFIKNNLILKDIIEGHGGADLDLMPFFYLYEDLKELKLFLQTAHPYFGGHQSSELRVARYIGIPWATAFPGDWKSFAQVCCGLAIHDFDHRFGYCADHATWNGTGFYVNVFAPVRQHHYQEHRAGYGV